MIENVEENNANFQKNVYGFASFLLNSLINSNNFSVDNFGFSI